MHVVCVTFEIRPGAMPQALPLIEARARNSFDCEAGCHSFDVCLADVGRTVFLYERYSDAEAFKEHLATAHFRKFDTADAKFVDAKDVRNYTLSE